MNELKFWLRVDQGYQYNLFAFFISGITQNKDAAISISPE